MDSARRKELIHILESAQADLEQVIAGLDEGELTRPGVVGEWSVKDILAHIVFWESRVTAWAEGIRTGEKPPPPPISGEITEDQENQIIYEQNRDRPLPEVLDDWRSTHRQVLQDVETMSEADLFERKVPWLEGNTFAEAMPGNSYEHLRHHAQDIRRWREAGLPANR